MTPARGSFCTCIASVLQRELSSGNRLARAPEITDWPQKGSVFAALQSDFKTPSHSWAASLKYGVPNDPRYGWYEDCCCTTHHHMLVAGEPRLRS